MLAVFWEIGKSFFFPGLEIFHFLPHFFFIKHLSLP